MKNNVDLELSFNDWDVSINKTLKEPRRAYFSDSESKVNYKYKCQVNFNCIASSWINFVLNTYEENLSLPKSSVTLDQDH